MPKLKPKSQNTLERVRKAWRKYRSSFLSFGIAAIVVCLFTIATSRFLGNEPSVNSANLQCDREFKLTLTDELRPQALFAGEGETACAYFDAERGEELTLETNGQVSLIYPNQEQIVFQGDRYEVLPEAGEYVIRWNSRSDSLTLSAKIENSSLPTPQPLSQSDPEPEPSPVVVSDNSKISVNDDRELSYNVTTPPPFYSDPVLQEVVEQVIDLAESRRLDVNNLSVSLVDLNRYPCCAYASYLDKRRRYPASIVKLFFAVAFYSQDKAGVTSESEFSNTQMGKMLQDSDNNETSRIVDVITGTRSGNADDLPIKTWTYQRKWMNRFFERAGYKNINISQKPFPIPDLQMDGPTGKDLEMRGNPSDPIRNFLTTYNTTRLMYEIQARQAVSPDYSDRVMKHLEKSLDPNVWGNIQYNSIEGFFGLALPTNAQLFSKIGWYSESRQEVALIISPDGAARYILTVFGEGKDYGEDEEIFPEISAMVYQQMLNRGY